MNATKMMGAFCVAGLCLAVWGPVPVCAAPDGARAPATVTYVSGSVVYVDVGADDGLRPGDQVAVVREGRTAGTLRVLYLSSKSASCTVETSDGDPRVGDHVRYAIRPDAGIGPALDPQAGVARIAGAGSQRPVRRGRGWFRDRGMGGRVGFGMMSLQGYGTGRRDVLQRTVDLRFAGTDVKDMPLSFSVDVRSRRIQRRSDTGQSVDGQARVNSLSGSWHPAGGAFELSVGRQSSSSLGSLGLFDGVLARVVRKRSQFGIMSATQPDMTTNGLSLDTWEHGLYYGFESPREAERRLALDAAIIGSYHRGTIDRENLALQQSYDDPALSVRLAEEVDINRRWKRAAGEAPLSLTSFYGYCNRRFSTRGTLTAGFDNRRNARLYRDREAGDDYFDESYKEGAWLGGSLRLRERFDVRGDARLSGIRAPGATQSYTLSLGASRLWPFGLAIQSRTTQYRRAGSEEWLHALSLDFTPGSRLQLELRGGTKQDPSLPGGDSLRRFLWLGADLDFSLTRHLLLLMSGEHRREGDERVDQLILRTTWRL